MPVNQSGPSSSATFGTYNDILGTGNTINSVTHVRNIYNQDNQDSSEHGALKRELKNILNPSIFTGDDRPQCLENTRKETLKVVYDWANTEGYPNVFLLIGAAGTGKSTLATTVAGEYQRRRQLGCHMFFIRERSHPGSIFQTIAYSLAVYNQTIAKTLVEQLKDSGDLDPSNLQTKFEILLRDPLSAVAADVRLPVLIVLDALDECGTPETRQSLMNILNNDLYTLPSNFRFLVTARPEGDILPLVSLPPLRVFTLNLDHRVEENRLSVSTYIKYELEKLKSSNAFVIAQDWNWEEGIQSLANTADGLFIWASTAIKFISEKKIGRFRHLKNLIENRNTLNLNGLYTAILKDAFEWDEEVKDAFVGVFSLILFCKTPLSVEVIDGILRTNTASDVLTCLRSLVMFEPDNPISIRHASFYDYLVSCKEHPWHIDAEVQKSYIATKCLERMGELLRYNICDLQSGYELNCDVPDLDNRVAQYIPPSLKYICCNWAHHLRDVSYSQELCSRLQSFAHNQLLFWFEVLSLTNTFDNNVGPALQFAVDWIGNNDPELLSFLRDAYRQASTYSEPISKSVLQIYTSLLLLTRKDSLMSIHYAKYASTRFRVEYIGRKQRSDCIKTIQVADEYAPTDLLIFSPDGTQFLSNSQRGVFLWDATSGELIAGPLAGDDKSRVLSAAYLHDGRYIILASRNGIIRKWDVLTKCLIWERVMVGRQIDLGLVVSVMFSPDGRSIVLGDYQGRIRIWNVDTGVQDGEPLEGHASFVTCLSFSSDGRYLVSGEDGMTIIVWDVARKEVKTGPLRRHTERVTAVSFSPNGNNVVSGSWDETIILWNAFTGEVLREIECKNKVYSITYSPNGLFILGGGEGWMSMWNVSSVVTPPKVFHVDESVSQTSFSPDGSRFMSGSCWHERPSIPTAKDTIHIWDASWNVEEIETTFEGQEKIDSIALSPGGKFIVSGSGVGHSIYLWNVLTGELVKKLELSYSIKSVSFSPINEQHIAFGSYDGTVQLWDVTNDEPVTIGKHTNQVFSTVFSPVDGKHIASGSQDKTICIWNVERRELAVGPLTGHMDSVLALVYSPDGTRIISGSVDETFRIWNSSTGQLLSTLNGHYSWVKSVAYSSDGSRIVSGSWDIRIWDAQSDQIICELITGHRSFVNSVCFSPDGKRILSGFEDKTARVWDTLTGQPLFPPFKGHTKYVSSVCFFPDGKRFATGSLDGTIRIWTLDEVPNDSIWELRDDNWVVSENGKLMIWIPKDLHKYLYRRGNVSILGLPFYLKLHFGTE